MNISYPEVALPYETLMQLGPAVSQWPSRMAVLISSQEGASPHLCREVGSSRQHCRNNTVISSLWGREGTWKILG